MRNETLIPFRAPEIGAGSAPIRIAQWLVEAGMPVSSGDRIVELLAEGIVFHATCEISGRIERIERPTGCIVRVGDVLAWIAP